MAKDSEMTDSFPTLHALMFIAMCAGSATALPPRYVVTPLEHPEPNSVRTIVPWDINDDGRMTGFAFHGFGTELTRQPCFWQDGQVELVPVDWDYTEARCLAADGTAFGIDLTSNALVHVTSEGITTVAQAQVNFYTYLLPATASGWVMGNHYDDGFAWHPDAGYALLANGSVADPVTIADVNEAGIAVGTANYSRAFTWQAGVMTNPASQLPGTTHATSIDEQNRVLLINESGGVAWVRYALLGDSEVTLEPPLLEIAGAALVDAKANEAGDIVATWSIDDVPYMAMRAAEGVEPLHIALPGDIIDIEIKGITDSGLAFGRIVDVNYESQGFVASVDGGLSILNHRLIGHEPLQFYGLPRDCNASGAMVITYAHNYNYGHWAMIEPARAGDANGTNGIDVADLLSIVDAWGPRPLDSVCGPDLNMDGQVDVQDLLEVLEHYGT
jgi:hypothetical protein